MASAAVLTRRRSALIYFKFATKTDVTRSAVTCESEMSVYACSAVSTGTSGTLIDTLFTSETGPAWLTETLESSPYLLTEASIQTRHKQSTLLQVPSTEGASEPRLTDALKATDAIHASSTKQTRTVRTIIDISLTIISCETKRTLTCVAKVLVYTGASVLAGRGETVVYAGLTDGASHALWTAADEIFAKILARSTIEARR